ncbi:type VI secretion system baseplate subunit TssG [Vibrio sp. S4M6]|uniref:type VI secretion system baseplate subunit TssG n=1 Tax=Vibrio sinus TaxID=2946865 RepID=UPI00202A7711|nr:type VI secretion system baseplate subunit TssG [Vibrio sinus]MCL9781344.1 type VI secretion system baseplate subunit TssG [Vibrio sinus]
MGNTNWSTAIDLDDQAELPNNETALPSALKPFEYLQNNARKYDFYQLVELIHDLAEADPGSEEWEMNCQLLFSANPSLGFASSDVSSLQSISAERQQLETNFLGLNGAHSPLPGFLLDQIATESEKGLRRAFLDFFNNRLLSLVYRIWRKYRYYIRYKPNASDDFSDQLFSLVGLADKDLQGKTALNKSKMLAYAGTLAGRSRSPQVVAGIIAHYFDLQHVSIRQWELRTVAIENDQRMQLGINKCELGEDVTLGSKVEDRSGKFVIEISNLTYSRFNDFLPTGKEYEPFCRLVEFVLREQLAYDLELELKEEEVPEMCIKQQSTNSLGCSSFLGGPSYNRRVKIQICP